jgi:hypothetical protein
MVLFSSLLQSLCPTALLISSGKRAARHSVSSTIECRIEAAQFYPGILGSELPVYLRDLQIIKIPFMMSSNFKTGGIEDEDINTGSEWRILTDGGLGCSFG